MSGWAFDTEKTQARYAALQAYYQTHGLNADSFACRYWSACSTSQKPGNINQYAGGTVGLMPFYDVSYRNQAVRIFVIGKEESHDPNKPYGTASNFEARSHHCLATIFAQRRTNHIKGTLLTLQRIFGVESDYVYASYALGNALRCGFQKPDVATNTSALQDTPTMWQNCIGYLVREIEILEPTLIIAQGRWSAVGKSSLVALLTFAFGAPTDLMRNESNSLYGLYEFADFMLITSQHPARLHLWKSRYAPDTVWPTIDHLKDTGYLPTITPQDAQSYELLVKPAVDKIFNPSE
jgi:hypothetical protein